MLVSMCLFGQILVPLAMIIKSSILTLSAITASVILTLFPMVQCEPMTLF